MDLERNILLIGEIKKSDLLISYLQENIDPKYNLNLTIINSVKDLYPTLKEKNIYLICIIDNLESITQDEILLNIYTSKYLDKPYIIFFDNLNIHSKFKSSTISNNSICTENKASFIYERLDFYLNMEKLFLEEYFSGGIDDYNIFEIFILISKLKKTGILSIKSNNDIYFDFYFKEGNLMNASGNNGYFPVNKLDSIKEFFKEINYKNSYFEFLSDINTPDIHFNRNSIDLISEIYSSLKLQNLDENNNSFISYKDIRKTIINTFEKEAIKKTIILNKDTKTVLANNKDEKSNFIPKKGGRKMPNSVDLNKAVEIAEDIYWVGNREAKSLLQVNSYLRVFRKGSKMVNLLVDPGPIEHFPVISKKTSSIIKDISRVNMYSLNHQDPDVGMNATFLAKINPKSACLCTEDTWNLAQFYDIPKNNYKNVYSFENKSVTVSTDSSHVMQFIPTPYCHFVGASAVYDRKTRILFSGDLFGGISPANNLELFATEEHWDGIKALHQIYIPSKRAIQNAIDNIRALDEPPLMIVPHHGAILVGEIMELFMNRLYHLDTGTDLFDKKEEKLTEPVYLDIMNKIFVKFSENTNIDILNSIFNFSNKNQEIFHFINIDENGIKNIYSNPERALNLLLKAIIKFNDYSIVNEIKSFAIKETLTRGLPMPVDIYTNIETDNDEDSNIFSNDNSVEDREESLFI